jgi:hypothetical protein
MVQAFTDEQRRVIINLGQHYEVWIDAMRRLANLPYGFRWRGEPGHEYLYEVLDRTRNAKSVGPRSPETEALVEKASADKAQARSRRDEAKARVDETSKLYRALGLPQIAPEAAKILREADIRNLLDSHLIVVGTTVMPAYAIEAGGRIIGPSETDDFDMAWTAVRSQADGTPVWTMLKAVDPTYRVNTERLFQARNSKAFEFELVAAPSRLPGMRRSDRPHPIPLPEQEWLLNGRFVSHVVVARDGSPARLVVPDPRWFALHKLWLSDKRQRDPLKKPKDRQQGTVMLNVVNEAMPHYPLDDAFEAELPEPLLPYFDQWRSANAMARPAPSW